ncbi:hypothetical protein IJ425_00665 [bacterium]|nr:hypothetical protein [bacterium]
MKITPQNINFNGFLRFKQTKSNLIESESCAIRPVGKNETDEVVINTSNIDNIVFKKSSSDVPNLKDAFVLTNAGERFTFRNITTSDFFDKLNKAHQQNTTETITLNQYNEENYKC